MDDFGDQLHLGWDSTPAVVQWYISMSVYGGEDWRHWNGFTVHLV